MADISTTYLDAGADSPRLARAALLETVQRVNALAASSGAALIGHTATGTGAVATTAQAKLRETMSVIDKGADPTGVSNSSTAFTNAGSDAYAAIVPAGTYLLNTTPTGRFLLLGNAKLTGAGAAACKAFRLAELPYLAPADSNQSFKGVSDVTSSVLILGDSITAASGATSYGLGYSFQVARSLINDRDFGYQQDPGFGWHTDINQAAAVFSGYTSTGSASAAGITNSRRSLAAGQSITITQRAFNTVYVVYDGAASAGSLVIAKNGTTLSTQAVSGATLNNTTAVSDTFTENDSLTITASGGTVVVCGVLTLKTAQNSAITYIAGQSGTAYQDYTTTTAMDEIAYWLNLFRSGSEKLLILALGTNNMYNAVKALSPSALITEIGTLIAGIQSRCSTIKFLISVPPKANESTFPQQVGGYAYQDYVDAIVEYAYANNHGLVRNDKSVLSRSTSYYGDGVHPDNYGHRIMAQTFCDSLGVTLQPYARTAFPSVSDLNADVTMNGAWRPYLNTAALKGKAHLNANLVTLSGRVEPNGSASTTLGTLPSGFRPIGRTCYFIGRSDAGAAALSIDESGVVVLTAVPATWISLEGISFPVNR